LASNTTVKSSIGTTSKPYRYKDNSDDIELSESESVADSTNEELTMPLEKININYVLPAEQASIEKRLKAIIAKCGEIARAMDRLAK
jgi:hypothetical protein